MIARLRSHRDDDYDPELDPDVGYFRRKRLRLDRLGVVAIGPSGPPQPPPEPDRITAHKIKARVERDHRETVEAEIAALDRRVGEVEQRLARLEARRRHGGESQELAAERRQCRELRAMLEDDLRAGPVTAFPDGRPVGEETRGYLRFRARELAESFWANAARADAEGDYRRGRTLRRDALRSRHIAENEMGLRRSLPGYGLAAWT